MQKKLITVVVAGAVALALAGCANDSASQAEQTPAVTSAPTATASASATPTATAEALTQLSDAELATIFTDGGFVPDEFGTTIELLDSVYPGLTASDASCLAPFGVGWDENAALEDATLEFGTSGDRSMTAVVASTGDADTASTLVADAEDALAECADKPVFEMQGFAVETSMEMTTPTINGTDEAIGWTVTGSVAGQSFTLIGITARVGGNVLALVGWDPETNEDYVPMATENFVGEL
jgi:hypothetical protein